MSDGYTIYIPVGGIIGIGICLLKLCCRAGNSNPSQRAAGTPRYLHMEEPATTSSATIPNSGQNHPPAFYPAPIHDPPPSYDTLKAEENKGFNGEGDSQTQKPPNMAVLPETTPYTTTTTTSDSSEAGSVTPQYPMAVVPGEQSVVDPDASATTSTVSHLPSPSAIVTSEEEQPSYPPPSYDQTTA